MTREDIPKAMASFGQVDSSLSRRYGARGTIARAWRPFRRPSERDVSTFQAIVRQAGLDVFVRKSRGRDVLGACGQLGNLSPEYAERALTQIESRC
jgi:hypothetical protein